MNTVGFTTCKNKSKQNSNFNLYDGWLYMSPAQISADFVEFVKGDVIYCHKHRQTT